VLDVKWRATLCRGRARRVGGRDRSAWLHFVAAADRVEAAKTHRPRSSVPNCPISLKLAMVSAFLNSILVTVQLGLAVAALGAAEHVISHTPKAETRSDAIATAVALSDATAIPAARFSAEVAPGSDATRVTASGEAMPPEQSAGRTAAPSSVGADASGESVPADQSQQRLIWRLIEQLGHSDYHMREQAQAELARLGFAAFEALTEVAENPAKYKDQEIASRAKYLLRMLRMTWGSMNDPPEVQNLLKDYESQTAGGKIARMRELAALSDGAGLPAICRLARYERPVILARQAVVQLLARRGAESPPTAEQAQMVLAQLGGSRRVPVEWLRCWAHFAAAPEQAVAQWRKLIEQERALLLSGSPDTSREILAAMLRFEIDWLKKLGRAEQLVAALRELIQLEPGRADSLEELLDWLVQQKSWESVDELAERFQSQFAANPLLMYLLASSYALRGDSQRAEQLAQQALRANPGTRLEDLLKHRAAAQWLRRRGLADWAEREFRHVIDNSAQNQTLKLAAQIELAEMFHDRDKHLEAAELLKQVCQAEGQPPGAIGSRTTTAIQSRMHYFLARHWQLRNQPDKQREHLQKAVPLQDQLDPDDVDLDAVIAYYRLKDHPPQQREKLLALIARMAEHYEEMIVDEPNSANAMNQYAWLVANTEGDLEKALRYSLRSIELAPDVGAYHDTLAHVYFAKGDYENAVKFQTRAAQLEPHSGAINRQLQFFRAKLEEKRRADKLKQQES